MWRESMLDHKDLLPPVDKFDVLRNAIILAVIASPNSRFFSVDDRSGAVLALDGIATGGDYGLEGTIQNSIKVFGKTMVLVRQPTKERKVSKENLNIIRNKMWFILEDIVGVEQVKKCRK